MEAKREEAAPTFPTWRRRLEESPENKRQEEVDRFLRVLKAVGTPMIDGPAVHFIYYGPDAQRVALVGEMNQWNRRGIALTPLRDTGFFYHTMQVRGPARVEYKFIVDGEWEVDPLCPNTIDNGIGEQNSFFVVGDFQEPPELQRVPTIPHGRVEEFDFESKRLNNRRRVYVYLPPQYDEATSSQRFPSLYVHDGGEYLSRALLATVLDNLISSQDIPPLIAVMVDPVDRMREYWANEDYGRFTEKELLPFIDDRYRTLARRESRGVMGASLGGLISTYLALSRPHLFSKVGGQSSAFFLEQDRIASLTRELKSPIAFYFDVGKYEPQFIPAHKRLVPLLEARGCPCFFQELAGGHNWTSWRAHLKDLLTFLWKPEPLPADEPVVARQKEATEEQPTPLPQWDFESFFSRFWGKWERLFVDWMQPYGWDSSVEMVVEGDALICKVVLPGIAPQDVEVLVVGNQIVIKGARSDSREPRSGVAPLLRSSRLERRLSLPAGVSADQVTARYRDGVLELSMPAPRDVTTRRVPIEER